MCELGYALVLRKEGQDLTTYPVGPEGLIVGRASESGVALPDSLVSRKHARVWVEGDDLHVEDLGSRNGIFVNGRQESATTLQEGDELAVGNHVLVVARAAREDALVDTGSMISFEKADAIYERIVHEEGSGRLPILYKAAQLMGTVFNQDELLSGILELIFEAVPAKRGFVLTLTPDSMQPAIRASLPADGGRSGPPLSRTLIRHVISEKNAVLTMNAQEDARFAASDSIIGYEIRSAMCAPLCCRDSLVGAIYVDSGMEESAPFSNEDLELLTALGRVVGVAVENARLHQERMASERLAAIGQATAGIGHCVKNILVGIKGGSEFIDMGLDRSDWSWIKKGWPLVRRSVDRVESLVMNLMAFSRDAELVLEPGRLEPLIQEVFSVVRQRAEKAGVELEFVDHRVGTVALDVRGMFRVILNLVTNAIDACEGTGGQVTVTAQRDSSGCYIEVSDTGPGIPPEIRDHLFQAFVTTKGSKGTGLGLACSRRIVEAHGGEISVDSTPGEGATFTVFLPDAPDGERKTRQITEVGPEAREQDGAR